MRPWLIACAVLLAGCGSSSLVIPPDLLEPEPGWEGAAPVTERQLLAAGLAERTGRLRANAKLAAVADIAAQVRR